MHELSLGEGDFKGGDGLEKGISRDEMDLGLMNGGVEIARVRILETMEEKKQREGIYGKE